MSNKLLFWLVSRPRRMKINCCFLYSPEESDDHNGERSQGRSSKRTNSKRAARSRVRIEDIGLPFDFRHTTHLGPDSDLSRAHEIVCTNF
ncbi:hypothetical protein Ocin01_12567 [Orchesella cincta]|uniref:CRIB domain-containing protein n=1 Tax=Orchesella cincta TaxID=48709 RepID=A0A1D2MM49_ORCCI|nr:hypothetical protein Ocin01_12567 [Orchesella cincta]